MSLFRLAFISVATAEVDDPLLSILRRQTVASNEQLGISGVLFTSHLRFLEVMEGDIGTISRVFSRVCKDTRHKDVRCVYLAPAEKRFYKNWSLGVFDFDRSPPQSTYDEIQQLLYRYQMLGLEGLHKAFDVFADRRGVCHFEEFMRDATNDLRVTE